MSIRENYREEKAWTVAETAHYLRLHSKTILRMIKEGTLPAGRVGRVYRISATAVRSWLNGN